MASKAATAVGRGRRQPERGSASTGHRTAAARRCTASGSPPPPPDHDHAALVARARAARASRAAGPSSGDPADAGARRPRRRAGRRQRSGLADERIAERQVQVHGPGRRAARVEHGPRRQRAPRRPHRLVGHARVGEPAHGAAEEVTLVDRLGRGHVAQLGRPVGGAHEQRHLGLVGLDHRGVELGGGRAARAQEHGRAAGGQPSPRARKDAERSSWWTCRRRSGSAASARASGVEREPGATTASVTPARTHSSTSVAQNVAAVVTGTIAWPTWPGRRSTCGHRHRNHRHRTAPPRARARLHPDGPVVGATSPPTWRPTTRWWPSTPPGTARRGSVRLGLTDGARAIAAAGGAGIYVGYSMGGRSCCERPWPAPSSSPAPCCWAPTPASRTPTERAARRDDRRRPGAAHRARRRRRLPRPLAGAAAVRVAARSAADVDDRRRNTAAGLASSLRLAGTGARTRSGPPWASSPCRCSSWPARRTRSSAPSASAWPPPSAKRRLRRRARRRPRRPPRAAGGSCGRPSSRRAPELAADARARRSAVVRP